MMYDLPGCEGVVLGVAADFGGLPLPLFGKAGDSDMTAGKHKNMINNTLLYCEQYNTTAQHCKYKCHTLFAWACISLY